MRFSPSMPPRNSRICGGPLGSHACSSSRIHCTRTGFPTARERSSASAAASSLPLPPYEPDPSRKMTRNLSSGMPKILEKFVRIPCVPCEEVQIVVPSGRTSATAQDGPSDAWLWQGHTYKAESCFAVPARAFDGSPLFTMVSSRSRAPSRTCRSRFSLPGSPSHSVHDAFSSFAARIAAHSSGATTPRKF